MSDPKISPVEASSQQQNAIADIFHRQARNQFVVARSTARERRAKLRRLHATVLRHEEDIRAAMWADFRKSPHEVDISETICVNSEIRYAIRRLGAWMAPRRAGVRLPLIGSSATIRYEPKGLCLIIGTWNFPFNINLIPLVGAIAAGNCAIIKPSEHAPHSAAVLKKIVAACFSDDEVAVLEGEVDVAQRLLALPFNHIFFTGSPSIGKIVMAAAVQHLASVTLELGGKTPVLVDETADLDRAASRIAWIKCLNGGQTCIAPDYVLVHESVHDKLVEKLGHWIAKYYGATPEARQQTPDLSRSVHERQFHLVKNLLDDAMERGARTAFGGRTDAAERYIEPTVLTHVPSDAAIWSNEIFGLLLPLRSYRTLDEAIAYINADHKPLAFYIFSRRARDIEQFIAETRGGGVCINECALQFFNPELPFGGHNNSGIGKYHGKSGFLEFSNARSVARQHSPFPTTDVFLPPYGSWLMNLALGWMKRWL